MPVAHETADYDDDVIVLLSTPYLVCLYDSSGAICRWADGSHNAGMVHWKVLETVKVIVESFPPLFRIFVDFPRAHVQDMVFQGFACYVAELDFDKSK
jgi:hypothetical protein